VQIYGENGTPGGKKGPHLERMGGGLGRLECFTKVIGVYTYGLYGKKGHPAL
jgi:hypothetical protein